MTEEMKQHVQEYHTPTPPATPFALDADRWPVLQRGWQTRTRSGELATMNCLDDKWRPVWHNGCHSDYWDAEAHAKWCRTQVKAFSPNNRDWYEYKQQPAPTPAPETVISHGRAYTRSDLVEQICRERDQARNELAEAKRQLEEAKKAHTERITRLGRELGSTRGERNNLRDELFTLRRTARAQVVEVITDALDKLDATANGGNQ